MTKQELEALLHEIRDLPVDDFAVAGRVASITAQISEEFDRLRAADEPNGDDDTLILDATFEEMLDNTLVPQEPLEVYSSNSYRRVGLKSRYHEVMSPTKDRDGHPNISNYAVLDALVAAFNAMLARHSRVNRGDEHGGK